MTSPKFSRNYHSCSFVTFTKSSIYYNLAIQSCVSNYWSIRQSVRRPTYALFIIPAGQKVDNCFIFHTVKFPHLCHHRVTGPPVLLLQSYAIHEPLRSITVMLCDFKMCNKILNPTKCEVQSFIIFLYTDPHLLADKRGLR